MDLRFTVSEADLRTGKQTGLFTLAYQLLDDHVLLEYKRAELRAALKWLEKESYLESVF